MSVRSGRRDGTASADACVVVDIVGACLLLLDDDVVVVFLIQLLLFRFKRFFFWHQYIFSIIHPFTYLFCLIQHGDFFFPLAACAYSEMADEVLSAALVR